MTQATKAKDDWVVSSSEQKLYCVCVGHIIIRRTVTVTVTETTTTMALVSEVAANGRS